MLRTADKDSDKPNAKARKLQSFTYNVMFRNREEHRTWFLGRVPSALNARDMKIEFVAVVQDDGAGMDPNATTHGLGLLGSSERAAGLGGVLQVQSTPGSGVQVSLWIPLSAPTRAANVADTERLPGTAAPSLATARHA